MNEHKVTITRFRQGSLRELLSISLPLMISALSTVTMMFVDRLFIAQFSSSAFNSVVNAGTMAWTFVYTGISLASMAEVIVAQYNGAGKEKDLGIPVWQMIWFSFFSIAIFLPLSQILTPMIYPDTPQGILCREYFSWLLIASPVFALYSALAAFYIGQGKTNLITLLSLLANFVNAILDYFLIFGIEGLFPPLGVKGAVWGTCLGQLFQAVVLMILFTKKSNRESYGTGKWNFHLPLFRKCLKIGIPPSLFYGIEILGWAVFYEQMASLGHVHITVSGVCQSLFILLTFFSDGIGKGASVIAGNFIGSNQKDLVTKTLIAGGRLHLIFFVLMAIPLLIFPEPIIHLFLQEISVGEHFEEIMQSCKNGLLLLLFYTFFQGLRWLISGVLTAAGDTYFLLLAGALSIWIFLIVPIQLFVVIPKGSVEKAWQIIVLYSIIGLGMYTWRFVKGKWKQIDLIRN